MTTALNIPLLPKQADFVFDTTHDELLYSGAFAAGKTRGLCYRAVLQASHPRARTCLARKRMTDLKRTTLRTLLEREGDLPPVLPEGTYHYVKTPGQEKIQLQNGGEITLFGFDDPQRVGSMQFSDLNIDEGIELDEPEWNMLAGRLRISYQLADGTRHKPTMATATNPAGPEHFLYKKFFTEHKPGFRRVIDTCAFDNTFLPTTYLHRLGETMHGAARLRYLFGKWVGADGLVFPMFDAGLHIRHDPGPWKYFIAGVDEGFTNPMVLRVHGVDGDGRSHVVASFYESGMVDDGLIEWCMLAKENWNPISFPVDPSAAKLIETMLRAGLDAYPANNDVDYGISTVRNRLIVQADGRPRLTFEPLYHEIDGRTTSAHGEYQTYIEKNSKPEKKNDHVPDADRYACVAIEDGMGGPIPAFTIDGTTSDRWSDNPGERVWEGTQQW